MSHQPTYNLKTGSAHWYFHNFRRKIQIFDGGIGNGKTTAACLKALKLMKVYPGSRGIILREREEDVNKTTRVEFLKWLPEDWVTKLPTDSSNVCILTNGSTCHFSYLKQRGAGKGQSVSNLLNTNFDWAIVDQVEDPGITEKDVRDLIGRLRNNTPYNPPPDEQYDETMPKTGPRWLFLLQNPSRGWTYRKLARPLLNFIKKGIRPTKKSEDDWDFFDSNGKLLFDYLCAPTQANEENLPADYLEALKATYGGAMYDRMVLGKHVVLDGQVYPMFDEELHVLSEKDVMTYYHTLIHEKKVVPTIIDGYDYGLSRPCCYLLGFVDHHGNVFFIRGVYGAELSIGDDVIPMIKQYRREFHAPDNLALVADPDVFRRKPTKGHRGVTISKWFQEEGIGVVPGINDVHSGIQHVNKFLTPQTYHKHPITGLAGAPYLYVSENLDWFVDEILDYVWEKDTGGEGLEKPMKKNDHAMDTMRYILTSRPKPAIVDSKRALQVPSYFQWSEVPDSVNKVLPRHR